MSQPDKTDLKIIKMLEEDGRRPCTEMAETIGLSESAVRKRISALQRNGVIRKFTVKVEPSRLGINTVAIVGVDAEPTKLLEIAQRLCEFEEVKCVATSSGDHMIITEVWTKDGRELTRFISDKLERMNGAKRICPALILEKLKG